MAQQTMVRPVGSILLMCVPKVQITHSMLATDFLPDAFDLLICIPSCITP